MALYRIYGHDGYTRMTGRNRTGRTRRQFCAGVGLAGAMLAGGCVGLGAPQSDGGSAQREQVTVGFEQVARGFTSPVGFEVPPGGNGHMYVVDQPGHVFVVDSGGRREETFLDLTDRVVDLSGYDERGLLGMAFHPEFATNRRVFVRYSAPPRAGTADDYSHTFVLSEFRANEDGTGVVEGSERAILEIPEPYANHNSGAIVFGPEGYLLVGVGDGGGQHDRAPGHVEDWYPDNEGGNGQDVTENLLGSVLRIDVDGGDPYAVPPDNPLVGREGLDEHYAWGFRNPWRMSVTDGELFVADVGQNRFEEVNLVEKGGNYGWNVREGTHCFSTDAPSDPPAECPDETPEGAPLIDPIVEYPHGGEEAPSGVAVIGGYRYRGSAIPALQDRYVFGDWQGAPVYAASRPEGDGQWPVTTVATAEESEATLGRFLLAFGRDSAGELYALTTDQGQPSGNSGALYRMVPAGGSAGTGTPAGGDAGDGTAESESRSATGEGGAGFGTLPALGGLALSTLAVTRRWR